MNAGWQIAGTLIKKKIDIIRKTSKIHPRTGHDGPEVE